MENYYVLDGGKPILVVRSSDGMSVNDVARHDDATWQYDYARETLAKGSLDIFQMVRLFGREAGYMSVSDYERSGRRVQKRDELFETDEEMDLRAEGEIVKTDPAKQNVFGWAYVAIDKSGEVNVDKSGDFIDAIEEVEESAYDYVLKSRAADADHTNVKGGEMIESIVFTPEKIEKMGLPADSIPLGWWIGFHIDDADTWARVEKGELTSFSIHGSGVRQKVAPE